MTENKRFYRFKLGHSGKLHSSEVYCDGELMITADVVDLLNEQDVTIKELGKENEQLKSKLFDCNLELEHSKESVDDAYWELTEIKKENEQLKQVIGEFVENPIEHNLWKLRTVLKGSDGND